MAPTLDFGSDHLIAPEMELGYSAELAWGFSLPLSLRPLPPNKYIT